MIRNSDRVNDLQMSTVLSHVAKKESFSLPSHVAALLARISNGNLRRAILSLEALHTQDPTFSNISTTVNEKRKESLDVIPRPDWEKFCSKVAQRILSEQTPERLLEVRGMLYELLVHCIPPTLIISVSLIFFNVASAYIKNFNLTDYYETSSGECG